MPAGGVCARVVVAERGDGVDRGAPKGTGGTDRWDAAGRRTFGRFGPSGAGVLHPVVVSARGGTGGEAGPAGDR